MDFILCVTYIINFVLTVDQMASKINKKTELVKTAPTTVVGDEAPSEEYNVRTMKFNKNIASEWGEHSAGKLNAFGENAAEGLFSPTALAILLEGLIQGGEEVFQNVKRTFINMVKAMVVVRLACLITKTNSAEGFEYRLDGYLFDAVNAIIPIYLSHVLSKRDSSVKSCVVEILLKLAAVIDCKDEVKLVANLSELGIDAASQTETCQLIISITMHIEEIDQKKQEKSGSDRRFMCMHRQWKYSKGRSVIPLTDLQIDSINKDVQELAEGMMHVKAASSLASVDDTFGTIEQFKVSGNCLNEITWTLFRVMGDAQSPSLTRCFRDLSVTIIDSNFEKIEKRRLKHGAIAQNRDKHMANSSIFLKLTSETRSRKRIRRSRGSLVLKLRNQMKVNLILMHAVQHTVVALIVITSIFAPAEAAFKAAAFPVIVQIPTDYLVEEV